MANADIAVPPPDDAENWLTIPQAAGLLNCSPRQVRALIQQDRLVYRRVTRRLTLVYRPSVEACAARQTGGRPEQE